MRPAHPGPPHRLRTPPGLRRAGPAGPAQHLGRGDACPGLALENPPPPRLIVAIPRNRARETLVERRPRLPAGQALHLLGGPDVPVDLPGTLGDVGLKR